MGRAKRKRPRPATEPAAAVASVLGDDRLLAEILLRLDSPTWPVLAALVCRRCLRRASDPAFLRRFRALHPPRVLGLRVVEIGFGRCQPRLLPVHRPPELAVPLGPYAARSRLRLPQRPPPRRDQRPRPYHAHHLRHSKLAAPGARQALPQPPPSGPKSLLRNNSGTCNGRSLLLLEDDGDAMSCLCLYLSYNGEEIGAGFSILQSGVWSNVRSSVTELPQRLFSTVVAHKLLVGSKFYIMTTLGYILGLDLTTASFFTVKLPDGARDSTTLKLSRPQHAGLYLIEAKGFQLRIWHGDGLEQRALVNTISVREACGHLRSRLARLQLLHFSATVSKPEKSHFTGSGGFFSSQFIFVLIYVTASCYNVATVLLQCFQRSRSQQEPCQTSP